MAELEPRVWWADVQHLREPLERRAGARRSERRPGGPHTAERRTIKIRGQVVPGAPRRELRDVRDEASEPFDLEAVVTPVARTPEPIGSVLPPRAGPRRPPRRPRERIGSRPDRIAGWAVVFVLMMALVAATSARGTTLVSRPASGASVRIAQTWPSAPQRIIRSTR